MIGLALLFAMGMVPGDQAAAVLRNPVAEFRVLPSGYVEAVLRSTGRQLQLDDAGVEPGDRLWIDGHAVEHAPYHLSGMHSGQRAELHAYAQDNSIEKRLIVQLSEDAPNLAIVSIEYRNIGRVPIHIDRIEFDRHRFSARRVDSATRADDFWTFQGSARKWGEGEVLAVDPKFERMNRMAIVDGPEGEGGGIPLVAFWTRRAGVATGGSMYYAFFASETVRGQTAGRWKGRIELRGLGAGRYRLLDYARGADIGVINSRSPFLDADSDSYLLLEAQPVRGAR